MLSDQAFIASVSSSKFGASLSSCANFSSSSSPSLSSSTSSAASVFSSTNSSASMAAALAQFAENQKQQQQQEASVITPAVSVSSVSNRITSQIQPSATIVASPTAQQQQQQQQQQPQQPTLDQRAQAYLVSYRQWELAKNQWWGQRQQEWYQECQYDQLPQSRPNRAAHFAYLNRLDLGQYITALITYDINFAPIEMDWVPCV